MAKRRSKTLSLDEQREIWYSHVSRTPGGMLPVYLGGNCLAWNIAAGPKAKVLEHFEASAPRERWPEWVKKLEEGHSG